MTLPDSSSAFKHPSLVLHFRCLLGSLGHHFGSFGGPFWEPKSFILGAWGGLGTQKKTIPKKSSKKEEKAHRTTSIVDTILAPFFNDVSVDFLIRFLDHFWSYFGAILGPKMEPKSMKNGFKIRSNFRSDFGMVIGTFLVNCGSVLGSLNPQKWSSRVGEVLFLRKSRFLGQMRFWIDF